MNAQTKIETPTVPAVYSAISAVMEHMSKEGIGKDRKNEQQKYKFRGIDDVYNALCGVLAANKLMMLPFVVDKEREERQTKSGGALTYTILTVDFKLVSAIDGSSDVVRMIGEAMDSADKSSNKAQSAALKYAALQVFMIPTEGDNDADSITHEVAPRSHGTNDQRAAITKIIQLCEALGGNQAQLICEAYKVRDFRELTSRQATSVIDRLETKLAEMAKEQSNGRGGDISDITDEDVPF